MRTGHCVNQLGLYRSACCDFESLFLRDDNLSRCPQCSQLCFWHLTEPVLTWQELEQLDATLELKLIAA
jgi:hypothetical protein